MDLKTLERYSSLSNRTLRTWIKAPKNPLPASARGAKILVSRRAFDEWMKEHAIEANANSVSRIVDDIIRSL
jgi:flavin-dependent dehydrogenase